MKHPFKFWFAALIVAAALTFFTDDLPAPDGAPPVACASMLPFLFVRRMDKEPEGGGGGGGAPMAQDAFQRTVLEKIDGVRKRHEDAATQLATMDKEGKAMAEKFDKQCKEFDGLSHQIKDVTLQLRKMEMKIATEARGQLGALEMIRCSEELNNLVNGIVRGTLASRGANIPIKESHQKAWDEHRKALATGSSPGSTYVATDELYAQLYSLIAEYGVWRQFDVIPSSAKTVRLLVDSTDPTMGFVAENTAPSEASYTGTSVSATIKKMLAWIAIANELLEDSEIDLTNHVLMKFVRATAFRMDWIALAADGTDDASDGAMTGIFEGGTAAVAASGNVSVATLDFEDWLATMLAAAPAVLSRPGTRWFLHPQMLVRALTLKDGDGRPLFLPSTAAPAPGALGSILGYPVTLAHAAPNTDGTSKRIASFGDPMGLGITLRKDLELAVSEHVKFTEDQTVFRGRARAACKVKAATAFANLTTAAS